MHFSLSHTLAVVSHEPLRRVPNFPEDKVQTDSSGAVSGHRHKSSVDTKGRDAPHVHLMARDGAAEFVGVG
ncbi:hypothetical protein CRUP_015131 [Coryphaenoides rupestris]|nr:hypothetical protein CRUP_015131 [Coryphaenoides rupestris]